MQKLAYMLHFYVNWYCLERLSYTLLTPQTFPKSKISRDRGRFVSLLCRVSGVLKSASLAGTHSLQSPYGPCFAAHEMR
jgi:hypothetical protein